MAISINYVRLLIATISTIIAITAMKTVVPAVIGNRFHPRPLFKNTAKFAVLIISRGDNNARPRHHDAQPHLLWG